MKQTSRQNGNVLFLILIAVALFAALSYAVTQSTRSGGGNTTNEKMQLAFDEIQNVVVAHRTAIQRMVMNGVDPSEISVEYPEGSRLNTKCSVDKCKLYVPGGGGLGYYDFWKVHRDLTPAANNNFLLISSVYGTFVAYQGTTMPDLVYAVYITPAFCDFINKKLGITTLASAMTQDTLGLTVPSGPFQQLDAVGNTPHANALTVGTATHLSGRTEGCYKTADQGFGEGNYVYFSTLQPY